MGGGFSEAGERRREEKGRRKGREKGKGGRKWEGGKGGKRGREGGRINEGTVNRNTGDKPGLLPALFKFGEVTMETAGCTFL